jgi:hypothetical protein
MRNDLGATRGYDFGLRSEFVEGLHHDGIAHFSFLGIDRLGQLGTND